MPITLSMFVEAISDDFQSTFTVVDEYTLTNMLGFPDDFRTLTKIIQNYMPNATVWFAKTGQLGDVNYDIYFIRVTSEVE